MKKYLIELFFFFIIPLVVIAVVAEYSVRKIPNDYAYKNTWLSNHSQEIEALYLGPSTVAYDIDPTISKINGFNAAHVSQPIKYDHFIFNKFFDQMKSLKYVIIGIDYWSPTGNMETTTEWWRIKYYTIYYNSPYHEGKSRYKYELYFHNTETLGIAIRGFFRFLGLSKISHLTVNERGYGTNYNTQKKVAEWDNGITEAERHNIMISESKENENPYNTNMDYIRDICKKCQERDVKVILLGAPIYKSYVNTIKKEYIEERDEFCNNIANSFDNTIYINMTQSDLFTESDFFDANHLNEIGTRKFTEILDQAILSIE